MKRISAIDVVNAYKATCLIPIRKAWQSADQRGGCAIDALAYHQYGTGGYSWAAENLQPEYALGFTDAWDVDDPTETLGQSDTNKNYLIGYWDAVLCRDAVEEAFGSVSEVETN